MKVSIKNNILFLNANGTVDKEKSISVPISNYSLFIKNDNGYKLFLNSDNRQELVNVFENEHKAIQAVEEVRKKIRNYFAFKRVIKGFNYIIYPVLIVGFTLSINGAITNAAYFSAQYQQVGMMQPGITQYESAAPAPTSITPNNSVMASVNTPDAQKLLDSLKQAAATGKFSVKLSSGHDKTLYVFSDPLCPYCQKIEPDLEEAAKHFNIEIFPVSVIGHEKSAPIVEQVLSTSEKYRVTTWKTAIENKPLSKDVEITDETKKFAEANNVAFSMMNLQGTPTIISDTGYEVPQRLIRDIPALKHQLSQE
ncbi:DsbC family protein [Xenorhabdus sp. KJ12.1]|uniref:DsbC family protein n=1 Tax=Xenorhabdus sp. KJ12.1 TaxID=1851571 RepID=UPI000C049D7D|nr:DsbC family protein [Xenorhabdus sp. KJ12.1]PHM67982.1 hypothetical protein Xekj_03705 [Xenorhabdus sp. KJ12.1]